MKIEVEMELWCDNGLDKVKITIDEEGIADVAEKMALEQYDCLSAKAHRIEFILDHVCR
jgi:hypothetical protein